MKTAAIIAEYNPFHSGHGYHIEQTRKETGADYVIAIISGNFVQRGAPAVIDKYDRTRAALSCGCDLVLELPVIYSCASAEFFAAGAVCLLDSLHVCDVLSFGSEAGRLNELSLLADVLQNEPEEFKITLKNHLKQGDSFPLAREKALRTYLKSQSYCQFSNEFWDSLKASNNILALEYLKALGKWGSNLAPFTISRKNTSYHDKKLYADISSATAIRHFLFSGGKMETLHGSVPPVSFEMLSAARERHSLLEPDDLTPYLHSALLSNPDSAAQILDLGEELSNRLRKTNWPVLTFEKLTDQLCSKTYTRSRIQRGLLHLILGIKDCTFKEHFQCHPAPYVKILGLRTDASPLLKAVKRNSSIPIITKQADGASIISTEASWCYEMDLRADLLYQSMLFQKNGLRTPGPMQRSPVVIAPSDSGFTQ